MNWAAIIRRYKSAHYPDLKEQLDWFASQPSFRQAAKIAAFATNHQGKRYGHQCLIRTSALPHAEAILLKNEEHLRACSSFEDLLSTVQQLLSSVDGLGELYFYDTALRLGAYLSLTPQRIYLHRGTRDGAIALGFDGKRRAIEIREIPEALQGLSAEELEDILCIFKSEFGYDAQPENSAYSEPAARGHCR